MTLCDSYLFILYSPNPFLSSLLASVGPPSGEAAAVRPEHGTSYLLMLLKTQNIFERRQQPHCCSVLILAQQHRLEFLDWPSQQRRPFVHPIESIAFGICSDAGEGFERFGANSVRVLPELFHNRACQLESVPIRRITLRLIHETRRSAHCRSSALASSTSTSGTNLMYLVNASSDSTPAARINTFTGVPTVRW